MSSIRIQVDGKDYEFDPADPDFGEAVAIESAFGGTYQQFGASLRDGSITARAILKWVLLRRDNPAIRVADVTGGISSSLVIDTGGITDVDDPGPGAGAGLPTPAGESASPPAEADTSPASPPSSESDPGSGGS